MIERRFPVDGPFDLVATTRALGVGTRDRSGRWWWVVADDEGASTLSIEHVADGIAAAAWGHHPEGLIGRVPELLGLDDRQRVDFRGTPAERFLVSLQGLRLGATRDVHGALVRSILGQVVTTAEAGASLRSMVRRWGEPGPGPRSDLRSIPVPSRIAALGYGDLHECGVERRRAEVLIEVSRRARRLAEIADMTPFEARRRLLGVKGIGPWTVELVVGSALGDSDAVPVGDYHLPNTVAYALAGEPRGDDALMLELLEQYRPERRRVVVAILQSGVRAPKYGPRTPVRRHI
jgi:3-methyladenine DNA glycosylase/8-oxoguanine DNA glycosylase